MTGFGRGEAQRDGITVSVELRTVNSRFLEVTARLPRSLSLRENDVKEVIRRKISRGKINMLASIEREDSGSLGLTVNAAAAKAYYRLLSDLRRTLRLRAPVRLEHMLQFSEIFEQRETAEASDAEWEALEEALISALDALAAMRRAEGGELERDFRQRIALLEGMLSDVGRLSAEQVPAERARLRERVAQLLEKTPVDEGRLEMELALMADRLDVTEECVRFRSHNKFFLEALASPEAVGRKLNFLIQEMNREANTIGSKSSAPAIAHIVVQMKEELEKVREQLQNIE